jgi:hypothetical protein
MAVKLVRTDSIIGLLEHQQLTYDDVVVIIESLNALPDEELQRSLIVSEARGVEAPDARVRNAAGRAINRPATVAVLTDSTLMRGALTSIGWFLNQVQLKAFESAATATPFLERSLRAIGRELSAADRALLGELDRMWASRVPATQLPSHLARELTRKRP